MLNNAVGLLESTCNSKIALSDGKSFMFVKTVYIAFVCVTTMGVIGEISEFGGESDLFHIKALIPLIGNGFPEPTYSMTN